MPESEALRLFDGDAGRRAILEVIPRFLGPARMENVATRAFVFRDET